MLVQLMLTFLLCNVVQVVKRVLATEHEREEKQVSTKMLFRDIQEELIALTRVLPQETVIALIPAFSAAEQVGAHLREVLRGCWCNRWQKANYHPRDPSKPAAVKPPRIRQKKTHDSVQRILDRDRK